MGRIIASINITPEGFCGHMDAVADDEHHQFAGDLLKKTNYLLLGRKTYQLFESFWPKANQDNTLSKSMREVAQLLNSIQKIVVSKTLEKVNWNNSTLLRDITADSISKLKDADRTVLLFGSPGLLSSMTALDLIDEYYFTIQPIIAGRGKRLFEELTLNRSLPLHYIETKKSKSGVVTVCYSRIAK